ncbi:trace amine-associated receptor 13c-like [Chanos chanos]|uniref:Trace amine-associated receptor 13c-like n=1 Tax=Chanos chanos TaxID=29144 RepID=A0A6J2W3H3_CHACN|nr:trace amine-associated receptor 13c-like [Chanos chanos]
MNFEEDNLTELCDKFSCPVQSFSAAVYALMYMTTSAVVLITVCGNLLVIISVCHFKRLQTPTNILILSLAVSDFLVGLFVMPLQLIMLIESCWIFGEAVCMLYIFFSFQLTCVSINNVTLIAVDRYLALNNPFFYYKTISLNVMFTLVLLIWLFSVVYNFILLYINDSLTNLHMCPGQCFYNADDEIGQVCSMFDFLVVFLVPCSIIIILYSKVFVIARRHAKAINKVNKENHLQEQGNQIQSTKSERKAAKVLGILVAVFLACLVPLYIYSVAGEKRNYDTNAELSESITFLFYINSSINPIIYALLYTWFQKSIKIMFSFRSCNRNASFINVLFVKTRK